MRISTILSRTLLFSALLMVGACAERDRPVSSLQPAAVEAFKKGVYGDPSTLLSAGHRFDELGMNAIFVRSISLNQVLYDAAKAQGAGVYVEFPTLLGRGYVEDHPDALPIDETGNPSPPADWFMGVCPTHSGFQGYRKQQLQTILADFKVDGIFLDYVHWHAQFETPNPILPETCFCDRCLAQFSKQSGVTVPTGKTAEQASWILKNADSQWRDWRNQVLNTWVSDLSAVVRKQQPEALVGIFYASWYPDDHKGALYRTLGIDVPAFARQADVLSPMLFHRTKGRTTEWIGEYTQWLAAEIERAEVQAPPQIWPIVQAHDSPDRVTPEEFRRAMLAGMKPPSSGIMMFSDRALLEDEAKRDLVREIYRNVPSSSQPVKNAVEATHQQ